MSRDPTVRGFWQPAVRSRRVPWGLVQCGLAAAWSALLVQCAVRKSWCTLTAVGIQVLNAMNKYSCKKLHVIGNHELYNFGRARLAELGLITAPYSSFKPHHSWRFIVVDAFDISTPGWDSGHPKSMAAWALLAEHNPNTQKASDRSLGPGLAPAALHRLASVALVARTGTRGHTRAGRGHGRTGRLHSLCAAWL